MKRSIYLFGLLLLAGAMAVSSCKKDDEEEPTVDLTPVLNFIGGTGYTSADATLAPASTFKVGINASENATSKSNIASFVVVRTHNNTPTTVFEKNNINDPTYTWEDDLVALAMAGEERWTFTITDKDGLKKELAIVITTTNPVLSFKNITMGSHDDAIGSFMNAETGTVMTKLEATDDQGSVDFAFYLGIVNKSTFGAPSNEDVKAVFELTGDWSLFNETLFELSTLSAADFDAITDSYSFPEFTGTEDDINNLEVGHVVYFKTVNNLHGLAKVNSISTKGDQINIDLIVEDK